jgi:hypothetical protein
MTNAASVTGMRESLAPVPDNSSAELTGIIELSLDDLDHVAGGGWLGDAWDHVKNTAEAAWDHVNGDNFKKAVVFGSAIIEWVIAHQPKSDQPGPGQT